MNSSQNAMVLLSVVFSLLSRDSFAASAMQDPLWSKAVAVSGANVGWVPGLVVIRSEIMHKGRSEGVHESWERSILGTNGEVITQTVKVLEDGKDVTPQPKSKTKGKSDARAVPPTGGNEAQIGVRTGDGQLFDRRAQDNVTVKRIDRTKLIDGRNCVAYEFEQRVRNGPVVKGVAWLENETGSPVEIENMTLDPLPDKHLKQTVITTRYESTRAGGWHVKEMVTTGTIGVLLIRADFRTTITFSDYWKRPKPEIAP